MIHILDYKSATFDYNPDILLQYVDVTRIFQKVISETPFIQEKLEKNGSVIYKRIEDYDRFTLPKFYEYIENNNDIEIVVCNIDIFENWQLDTNQFFDKISKKYPNIKFIVSSDETFFKYSEQESNHFNVFYILNGIINPYSFIDNTDWIRNYCNFYITNNYLQEDYINFLKKIFYLTNDMVRDKKYNFYNGVHKPHRLKCYELIKNNNLLEEGYFSYSDFAELSKDKSYIYDYMNFLDIKSLEEYNDYISKFEIPYYYDTKDSDPNVFVAFSNPPQTALQSYISITTETSFYSDEESNNFIFSEKAYKGFFGFNIPLIIGQPTGIRYLKDLGFDLFEDLFDVSPKYTKSEIFEQANKNFSIIKSMSKSEIYDYYVNNMHRVFQNYDLLTNQLKQRDIDKLEGFLNER
jgi:hypothetical protein